MLNFWETMSNYVFTSPFLFLLVAVMIKCLLILFYGSLIYFLVCSAKRLLHGRLGAKAGYYCWYSLLLALPLSGLELNDSLKLSLYKLSLGGDGPGISGIWIDYSAVWNILCGFALLWFLVILFRIESHVVTNIKLEGAVGLMKPTDAHDLKNKAAEVFGINAKKISLVEADFVSSPLTYGIFRKTILLPRSYKSRYSEDTLYMLLLHEMAHIKNSDMLKLHLVSIANCLFLLPPGFIKKFKQDSEILCDNRVMGVRGIAAEAYGELLLKECSHKSDIIPGLAFSDSFLALESRLEALFKLGPEKYNFALFSRLVFVLLLSAFIHDCITLPQWYKAAHPEKPRFNIIVAFEGEDMSDVLTLNSLLNGDPKPRISRNSSVETEELQNLLSGRPGGEIFDGTWEYREDGTIALDKKAIYEILKTVERNGVKANRAYFAMPYYEFDTKLSLGYSMDYVDTANVERDIQLESLELYPYYIIDSQSGGILGYFKLLAAQWL